MNPNLPLISVIIPVYNVEPYLSRCLDSVCKQTYRNLEILLIDDGSTDHSLKLCQNYAQKDKRIRVFHQENQGVSAARNLGLEHMSGEFFTFVDADDWIVPQFVQKLFELAVQYNTPLAQASSLEQYDNQPPAFATGPFLEGVVSNQESFLCTAHKTTANIASKLYRTEVFRHLRFNSQYALGEDIFFFFKALQLTKTVASTNRQLYVYCRRENSATTLPSIQARFFNFKLWQQLSNLCQTCQSANAAHASQELTFGAAVALAFSILVGKEHPAKHACALQEASTYLQQNKAQLWKGNMMGLAGKMFIYFYLHFPQTATLFCRLPGIRNCLYTIALKRLSRYRNPNEHP